MKVLYKNWFVHNMFAHPAMELAYWLLRIIVAKENAVAWSQVIPDCTLPESEVE